MPSNTNPTDTPVNDHTRKRPARDSNSDDDKVEKQATPKPGNIQDLFDCRTSRKQQRISISNPVTVSPYDGVTTPVAASRIGNSNNNNSTNLKATVQQPSLLHPFHLTVALTHSSIPRIPSLSIPRSR
jgi:hypothetical protein